jgi:hypothetical protein
MASPCQESIRMRLRFAAAFSAVVLGWAGGAAAQAVIPSQMHTSFTFELHSVKDEVLVYEGDPQYLLKTDIQPANTLYPRIDFTNTNQVVTLRVRDLSLFDVAVIDSARAAEDAELGIHDDSPSKPPQSQVWELQLAPACAGEYVLQCDGGKGVFDFTDLPVQKVQLMADTTNVQVAFKRPNPAVLERFKLTVRAGKVLFDRFLNARAKSTTLQLDESDCTLDFTGTPFTGDGEVFFEGTPKRLRITLPRNAGLRVEGPSAIVTRFDRPGMAVAGAALETADFAAQRCKLRFYFSQPLPKVEIHWSE